MMPLIALKIGLFAAAIVVWVVSQKWLGSRASTQGQISDAIHRLLEPGHLWLTQNHRWADALLVASSAGVDALGLFLLWSALCGPSLRPFVGLVMLFALRQANQWATGLPAPKGVIWRHPGVPSIFVTYDVANDLFFSGHTALAVYGAIELSRLGSPAWTAVGVAIAGFEILAVLLLRAHWTMDVFAGAITALWVATVAPLATAPIDRWLLSFAG